MRVWLSMRSKLMQRRVVLALKIVNVDAAQASTQKRFDGPAVQAAYDAEGKPTKALEGFMRGQGITVDQVSTFQAGKVEKAAA